MACKAHNDTAGPDGLVPTLLVFGVYPRISADDSPVATVAVRAKAVRKAMKEVRRCHAARAVHDALCMRNGPATFHLKDLPLNSEVVVYREKEGWDQTSRCLVSLEGEIAMIDINGNVKPFRSISVRPFIWDSNSIVDSAIALQNRPDVVSNNLGILNSERPPPVRRSERNQPAVEEEIEEELSESVLESPPIPRNSRIEVRIPRRLPENDHFFSRFDPDSHEELSHIFTQSVLQNVQDNSLAQPQPSRGASATASSQPSPTGTSDEAGMLEKIMEKLIRETSPEKIYLTEKKARAHQLSRQLRSEGKIITLGAPFEQSRQKEMDGLLAQGVYEVIDGNAVELIGKKIFGSRIVDEIKGKEIATLYEKSRLVVQAFNDEGKKEILTQLLII